MTNSVNIKIQCLATLLIPTGLYAFKRIDKLKQGIEIYAITFIISIIITILPYVYWGMILGKINDITSNDIYSVYNIITIVIGLILSLVPIYFIRKWSIKWNQNIIRANLKSL